MPTIADNKRVWDGDHRWTERGDEWSRPWGGPTLQWHCTLMPRIQAFLPAGRILEIACGYGRWTHFLKDWCKALVALDLSQECVDACRERFRHAAHIEYHVNDGKSLDMIPDRSVDLVFSFDSLVHADMGVMAAYVGQLSRILSDDGAAFLHHSNLGEYGATYANVRKVPKLEGLLITLGALDPFLHWRDPGVSAAAVARVAEDSGLQCVTQEVVHWETRRALIDCMSTIARQGSRWDTGSRLLRNEQFMQEAGNAARLAPLYDYARR
jgi:SAM-dependent methyltransferase